MIYRNIQQRLLDALADTPVVLPHGARQTGKTTLVRAIAREQHPARYVTFDDPAVLRAAQSDPQGFTEREVRYLQYVRRNREKKTPGLAPPIDGQLGRACQLGRPLHLIEHDGVVPRTRTASVEAAPSRSHVANTLFEPAET